MPTRKSPRKGSLQFWPRKRASKFLPRVNWNAIDSSKPIKGFICYKAGMTTAIVKDNTPDSLTKGKEISIPVTLLECPHMKILSIRFYKNNKVALDILAKDLEKELKKKIKLPKKEGKKIEELKLEDYDEARIIAYSHVKKTGMKKTPDIVEIGITGKIQEQIEFIKEKIGKEISVLDFFEKGQLIDLRGLTKGKGLQGPVRRFGITLKSHKSEKGQRRPGSLGPWHPARVTFRAPMAGQLGMFTRVIYNNVILDINKSQEKIKNLNKYGDIKTDYIAVKGSIQGPAKRQLILTEAIRPSKKQSKKIFELIELR